MGKKRVTIQTMRALARTPATDTGCPWDDQLADLVVGAANQALRHPRAFAWLISSYAKRPPMLVFDDAVLALLDEGGLSCEAARHAKGAIARLLVGHIALAKTVESPVEGEGDTPFDSTLVLRTGVAGIVAIFGEN